MGPGFVRGIIVGAGAAALGLSALSLSVPLPSSPRARTEAPVAVAGSLTGSDSAEVAERGPDADLVELPPTAPVDSQGTSSTPVTVAPSMTTPAAVPQVAARTETLDAPSDPVARANVDIQTASDGGIASAPSIAPEQPDEEIELSISTEPAQPILPEVSEETAFGAAPETDPAPEVATTSDPELAVDMADGISEPEDGRVAAPVGETESAALPEVGAETEEMASPAQPETAPDLTAAADPALSAEQGDSIAAPATDQIERLPSETASAGHPQVGTPTTALGQPEGASQSAGIAIDPDAPVKSGTAGAAPTSPAGETELAVTTDPAERPAPVEQPAQPRLAALPQIGSDRIQPAEPEEAESAEVRQGPPISAYAVPFDNSMNRPLMSIVLIDEPGSIGAEALSDFPYPLTFALDPGMPGAVERMKAHRAMGFEVVALIDLPVAASPTDAEVSMSIWLSTLNQVVAVLEGTKTGFQGNRPLSDQVTDIAAHSGLGLITQDNGLNTVQKLAARDGVPSTVVFRDFDGASQTPTVMRRFLDQAAFRAGQQGSVVMLGRLRPDTVSALLLWGLQDRASRVALAPISAVLTKSPK